jgi:DNA-binding transcriptional ArsR family regulator
MKSTDAIASLAALAQETRLAIFRLLVQAGPEGVAAGVIAEKLGVSPATLSFHLKELARAELVTPRTAARFIYYSANYDRMADLMAYLTQHCCRGMPPDCLATVETALAGCCAPAPERT